MSDALELYKLRFSQMESVRAAHRETRRFHIALNVTGVSTLLGFRSQLGEFGFEIVSGASFGLMLMCAVWFMTTDYAARSIAFKAKSVLDLEAQQGLSFFKDELWAMHRSTRPPQFFFDRLFAISLGVLYAAVSGAAAWIAAGGAVPDFVAQVLR